MQVHASEWQQQRTRADQRRRARNWALAMVLCTVAISLVQSW